MVKPNQLAHLHYCQKWHMRMATASYKVTGHAFYVEGCHTVICTFKTYKENRSFFFYEGFPAQNKGSTCLRADKTSCSEMTWLRQGDGLYFVMLAVVCPCCLKQHHGVTLTHSSVQHWPAWSPVALSSNMLLIGPEPDGCPVSWQRYLALPHAVFPESGCSYRKINQLPNCE